MKIVIPTLGRVGKQPTWDAIKNTKWRDKTVLVCPVEEVESHKCFNRNVWACPVNGHSEIGTVRQWIVDNCEEELVLMMDDDLVFAKFLEEKPSLVRIDSNAEEISNMINEIEKMFIESPCVGLAFRNGANRNWPNKYKSNTRIHTVMGFHIPTLKKENIRFDTPGVALMEDMHVVISLLKKGYSNSCLYSHTYDQPSSNASGGCSLYRNAERMYEVSHKMQELHAPFIKAVQKETKGRWSGMDNVRWDINVQWKKAYEYGRNDNAKY